ncbi:DUF4129 domain-containing protein [Paenibacillus alkaliterrae]|uniref:DUF4129 domain-containing transglutaminase family protein n=1 Tax=Paenibacillus alkaliterrae TaxID=320909 RepID=UPI001F470B18|nr:transglutaminase domain-containing protein [Paenibacillus alkaliterrae]MCF2939821.1 DUF4129 domain-containing protein [Paenibacillus alkaliterrae]
MKRGLKGFAAYLTADWYEKLSSVFIAVILANTIAIFESYWWDETYAIAYFTIFMAAAVDVLLPHRMRFIKLLLQTAGAIMITTQLARMDWIVGRPERWQEWVWWLQVHAVQLHPFIWISAVLLMLHVLFGIWTTTRARMFGLIGVSLLILTIADSFTPIWLWDEAGMVVFIGLLWLVANHLSRLQRNHPRSWEELLEYPLQLILPIALVLSVLMTVGLNMPSLSPILQDPYTIWKESRGEKVRVFIGDKGADSRTPGSTGNASSGYSRSDELLGGGFEYDYSPMMTVSTSHRSYWRGESKSIYTGDGWVDGDAEADDITRVQKGVELSSFDEPPAAGSIQVDQIVTMIRKDSYPVLFAASPVAKVNWVGNDKAPIPNGLIWMPGSLELRLLDWSVQYENYPKAYSLTSSVPVLDEAALRSSQAGWPGSANAARNAFYLQLPDTLPARVKELAEEVTSEGTNDYDRAKLLEAYLQLNYSYNNKPDESKLTGTSVDFVDRFLFELQEGYCDYFSTSMAVMARSLGLPARWVKGFAPGALPVSAYGPPEEYMGEELNPTGAGTYTVRNSDAHSWVEIYFEGFGWIPFEATAGFSFPYSVAEEETEPLPEVDTDGAEVSSPNAAKGGSNGKVWAWSSVSLLAAAAAAWLILRRGQVVAAWRKLRHGSYTSNDRIVIETQKLLRICKKRGMERQEHETMREAVLRWSQSQKRLRDDFRAVLDGFERAKYSPVIASAEEADRFVIKVRSLIDQLR